MELVPAGQAVEYAWARLSRYQNIAYTAKILSTLHQLGPAHARNVRKQATQIRYCLLQAKEYFEAARGVSAATRPLLLYYGIMSLALAQVLMKGTGDSSLDRARGQNAHHGLVLKHRENPSAQNDLTAAASALAAAPHVNGNGLRVGTFELWHALSREAPIVGSQKTYFSNGGVRSRLITIAVGRDEEMEALEVGGISLLKCFQNTPGMSAILPTLGVEGELVKAHVTFEEHEATNECVTALIIQPGDQALLDRVCSMCIFEPRLLHQLEIVEMPSGYIIRDRFVTGSDQCAASYPNAFQIDSKNVFLSAGIQSLNEFGVLYAGIYILGNYARYYPEQWMKDVEESSDLSHAVEGFMSIVEERGPLLTLSELARIFFVPEHRSQ